MTKKPRRLGRGFSSFLEDNHRPLGGGQCSQQRYLTPSQRAEQINFRLWAGGHFTLRKPLCAYGLISQPVQLSALPGRAPTNRPSPPGRGSFYFGPPQLAASSFSGSSGDVESALAAVRIRPNIARMVGKFPPAYELTTRPCTIHAGRHRWVITGNGKPVQTSMDSFETPERAHADGRIVLEKLVKSSRIGQ